MDADLRRSGKGYHEKTALKILAGEASHGHVHYETMVAVPFEEFAKLME